MVMYWVVLALGVAFGGWSVGHVAVVLLSCIASTLWTIAGSLSSIRLSLESIEKNQRSLRSGAEHQLEQLRVGLKGLSEWGPIFERRLGSLGDYVHKVRSVTKNIDDTLYRIEEQVEKVAEVAAGETAK